MKKLPFILFIFLIAYSCSFAQPACPSISITGPSGIVEPGEPVTFSAVVESSAEKLTYQWSVSSGQIVQGQGATTILAKPENAYAFNLTATLEIGGLPEGCPKTISETASQVIDVAPELIDEFRAPITVKYKPRFENIAQKLREDPASRLVIILYYDNEKQRAAGKRAIFKYLKLPEDARVTFVDSTRDDGYAAFWLVPLGASDPIP
jgi:hypothetical protein